MLLQLLSNFGSTTTAEVEAVSSAIFGCAGFNTTTSICTYCAEEERIIDLLNTLDGNPQGGGTWTDLTQSGIDISDPSQVNFSSVGTGSYQFLYRLRNGSGCPDDAATLTINVTSTDQLACRDTINITLGSGCTFELRPENILTTTLGFCDAPIEAFAYDEDNRYLGSIITEAQLGKVLPVVVGNPDCSDPICTSAIRVEDKSIPTITTTNWLPDQIDLICHDLSLVLNNEKTWLEPDYKYYLGGPVIAECSGFDYIVNDNVEFLDCDPQVYAILRRSFVVSDRFGNFVDTTLEAVFEYPDISQASKFDDIIVQDCTPGDTTVPKTYPYVINAFMDTVLLTDNGCNYSIGFEDKDFIVCNGSVKVERIIKYFNWCTDEVVPIDSLVIKVGDFEGPQISGKGDTAIINTSPFQCGATINLREDEIERLFNVDIDDCNTTTAVKGRVYSYLPNFNFVDSSFQEGPAINDGFYVTNIPAGLHQLVLTMTDGCKSDATDTLYFRVVDRVKPNMLCLDGLIVSMSQGPYGAVSIYDINEGSIDNCGLVDMKVRRLVPEEARGAFDYDGDGKILGDELDDEGYTRFDDERTDGLEVEFFCDDLLNPEHNIELHGWDAEGNKSTCWASVLLEDKVPPGCLAPKDTVIHCYDFDDNKLDLYGLALPTFGTCAAVEIEELDPIEETDQCGVGMLIRRFRAIKNKGTDRERIGPLCAQTIKVELVNNYTIKFPKDVDASCGSDPMIPEPVVVDSACGLFATDVDDIRLDAANDECYKILRTYKIINWCEFQDKEAVVVPRNVNRDTFPGAEDIYVIVKPNEINYYDQNDDERDTIPNLKGYWISSLEVPSIKSVGYWQYTQHIRVYDTTDPIIAFESNLEFPARKDNAVRDCVGDIDLPFRIEETCSDYLDLKVYINEFNSDFGLLEVPEAHLDGEFPNYVIIGEYPVGEHTFMIEASDGCGNTAKFDIPFAVVDTKAPAPICADNIVVEMSYLEQDEELIPFGDVRVDAFLVSPIFDCSGQGFDGLVEIYSINRSGEPADQDQTRLTFDCEDANNYVPVQIHAWDEAGNHDYCETFVQVQDNRSVCDDGFGSEGEINGFIQTPEGRNVENVEVNLNGGESWMYMTDADGLYEFKDLQEGENYTLRPIKKDSPKNGVSTFDLIIVQKHVLGSDLIIDPYKLIAADINNSGSISTIDMIQLRKIVLNVSQEFNNNTSWRFVDASYEFPDPTDPWRETFPEVLRIDEMTKAAEGNFIGIKIGDVNGSATPNSVIASAEVRTQAALKVVSAERLLEPGQTYAIPLMVEDLDPIEGLQGTIEYDKDALNLIDIDYSLINQSNVGLFRPEGQMSFSWNRETLGNQFLSPTLMILYLEAEREVQLSEVLHLNSDQTSLEAYNIFGEVMQVELDLMTNKMEYESELMQNVPNPFRESTVFQYYLGAEGKVGFQVYNLQGQLIWEQQHEHQRGQHSLELGKSIFPNSGVYLLRMQTKDFTSQKTFVYH